MTSVITIVLAGAASYVMRSALILGADKWQPPAAFTHASALIAPAAFAAIAAAAIFGYVRTDIVGSLPLVGGLVAGAIGVHRTGSPNTALIIGLPTIWLLSAAL